jgi:chromosome segregation ATPase
MRLIKVCIAVLFFITLLFSGCVSKSTYDKAQSELATAQQSLTAATAERDTIKTQLTQLQSDMTTAQTQLAKAQSELATAQQSLTSATADRDASKAQLSKAQSELTTTQGSLATLKNSLKKAQPYVDITSGYLNMLIAGFGGSTIGALSAYNQISAGLSAANDSALKVAWDNFMANTENDDIHIFFVKLLIQRLNDTEPKTN